MILEAIRENIEDNTEEIIYKRMRISIKEVYRNEDYSLKFDQYVMSFRGVEKVNSNPITGRTLIIFNEKETNEITIKKEIYRHITNISAVVHKNVVKLVSDKFHKSVSPSVPMEENIIDFSQKKTAYHSLNSYKLEKMFKTNYTLGLTSTLAHDGIKKHGLNIISEKKKKSLFATFIEGIKETTVRVLLGASLVSLLVGQIPEAIALGGIVLFQTCLGAIEQYRSENSLQSLKHMLVQKTKVLRNGKLQEIDAKYLVPGDVIFCEAGDKVPADVRVIECEDLKASEASLTGESTAVVKSAKVCKKDTELASRFNMLFMGSNIISGRCKALVVATGKNTEIGKIASMLNEISEEPTPLQHKTEKFINKLIKIYLGCFAVIGSIALMSGSTFAQVLLMGVTFFLGSIPEGLPVTVTTAMAMSVHRMAKKNAIVRKLTAVESLGAADVICCDKTGTLTMNEMTIRRIYTDGCLYNVTGLGYNPEGEINLLEGNSSQNSSLELLLRAGVFCNTASLLHKQDKWEAQGDPTEAALITAAYKHRIPVDLLKEQHRCIKEIPFDSQKRYMTSLVKSEEGEFFAYCKGSLETIIEKCKYIYKDGKKQHFTKEEKEKIQCSCDDMAEKSLRVLAFSYKSLQHKDDDIEEDMIFLGIVGMEDPPKEGVRDSIQKCLKAGIKVVMITGDHSKTASAIGKDLGLLTDGLVICGSDIESMSDKELDSIINKVQVFARTTPEQKYKIVQAFKRCGNVVAMTGDGVNDAPAIKEANIGIAMGKNGSDVAKDAACITLVDDNFSTIVAAIEEGRGVSNNIRSIMRYLFAGAMGEMLSIFLSFVTGSPAPFIAIQMIWINLVAETLLGSSLALESPSEDAMTKPPCSKDAPLIDRKLKGQIIKRGIGVGVSTFAIFKGSMFLGASIAKARTLAFANFIGSQIINVYDSRSNPNTLPNKNMNRMIISSAIMLVSIIYVPFLNALFGTVPIGPLGIGSVLLSSSLSRI